MNKKQLIQRISNLPGYLFRRLDVSEGVQPFKRKRALYKAIKRNELKALIRAYKIIQKHREHKILNRSNGESNQ